MFYSKLRSMIICILTLDKYFKCGLLGIFVGFELKFFRSSCTRGLRLGYDQQPKGLNNGLFLRNKNKDNV